MKLAIQLYSVREQLGADMAETLRKVKNMGYDGVEWPFFCGRTAAEAVEMSKAAGLEAFSMHVNYDNICGAAPLDLAELVGLGFRYFVLGWLPQDRLYGTPLYEETLANLRAFAESVRKAGGYLLYHNHDFDLAPVGQTRRLDALLNDLPADLLGAEIDTCWVAYGGGDVNTYLETYGDRAPIVHVKDYTTVDGKFEFRAVGEGCLDFAEILARCGKAEWICVEQDNPTPGKDEFTCAEESIANLKKLLQ